MDGRRPLGPTRLTASAVGLGLAVTIVVTVVPSLHFAYSSEATHLVLETADGTIAAIAALLLYGRFRRDHALPNLLLGYALALLAIAAIGFATISVLAGAGQTDAVRTWAPLAIRIMGSALFAAAAVVPANQLAVRKPPSDVAILAVVVAAILTAALLAPHALPVALDPTLRPEDSSTPHFNGHPGVLIAQLGQFVFYGVASVAFTRRAERTGDEFTAWIGAAAGLSAAARVNYVLFPSLFSEYVYIGDFLRTGAYLLLLIGGAREIEKYWVRIAAAAAIEERQRVARDLHDGLTQELTYIWSQLQQLEHHPERSETIPRLTSAAARALDEARRAIAALTRPTDEPIAIALTQAAEEVAGRYGASIAVDIKNVEVEASRRESLIRIVREAVSNAARHASADSILVQLAQDGHRLKLVVSDDGHGFSIANNGSRRGYGLTTMKQRAEQSGARFTLDSDSRGTSVTVVWDA